MMTISEILSKSWSDLKGKVWRSIGFLLLFTIITQFLQRSSSVILIVSGGGFAAELFSVVVAVVVMIVSAPLSAGLIRFFIKIVRGEDANTKDMFWALPYTFKAFALSFTSGLLIFLWTLLLIIPGIIAAYNYLLIFYIFSDKPELTAMETITLSKKMMYGHRLQFVWLSLIFFGVFLLCVLTIGIGFIWAIPWSYISMANFYESVRIDYESKLIAE